MWKDSIRNVVVIFQPNILRIVGFYVKHSSSRYLDMIFQIEIIYEKKFDPNVLHQYNSLLFLSR